jgi:hypothetical protein
MWHLVRIRTRLGYEIFLCTKLLGSCPLNLVPLYIPHEGQINITTEIRVLYSLCEYIYCIVYFNQIGLLVQLASATILYGIRVKRSRVGGPAHAVF